MRLSVLSVLGAAFWASVPHVATAQDRYFNFAITGGVSAAPEYPGSSDVTASPNLNLTFGALRWGKTQLGSGIRATPDNGLALRGAFNVIGSRTAAESPELAGLNDVDAAVELGLNLTYQETNWMVFGEVRQGFGGHEGITGTLGSDLIFRPNDRLTVTAGPRLNFGNSDFSQTYFGVSGAEAAASSYNAFDANGGLLGMGFQVGATYALDEAWAIEGAVRYERLKNDAAISPITSSGSDDQWSVNVGLSRAFTLRF